MLKTICFGTKEKDMRRNKNSARPLSLILAQNRSGTHLAGDWVQLDDGSYVWVGHT